MERYIKRDELVDSQGLTVEADAMKKEGDIKVITFYKFSVTVKAVHSNEIRKLCELATILKKLTPSTMMAFS